MRRRVKTPAGGAEPNRSRVGSARPSQMMYAYGVGSQIDLPNVSVVVAGLDSWGTPLERIVEDRLLREVQATLGPQVSSLMALPWKAREFGPSDPSIWTGVPVLPFPRWMRCSVCNLLALSRADGGVFSFRASPHRPERARFVHENCPRMRSKRPADVVPARFVVACKNGHLDDFPWQAFVHGGGMCSAGGGALRLTNTGVGARSTDLMARCDACEKYAFIGAAFARDTAVLPRCRGRHVHLPGQKPEECAERTEAMLLGASNLWFPELRSVFHLPPSPEDELGGFAVSLWSQLEGIRSAEILQYALTNVPALSPLAAFTPDEVWGAIEKHRASGDTLTDEDERDLKRPEWERFTNSAGIPSTEEFSVVEKAVPPRFTDCIARVVAATRLREVVALVGFARVEPPDADAASYEAPDVRRVPLSGATVPWVPAAENRGEGIFLALREDHMSAWTETAQRSGLLDGMERVHRKRRNTPWPGARFVLLHSLAHLMINEVALRCGYSAASIRERIYSGLPELREPMAGFVLYTASPDAEGTLGGLVSLAEPDRLDALLTGALQRAEICGSDPLCASHEPDPLEGDLHGAACHACLFLPETSCEAGNQYLDRRTLLATAFGSSVPFFNVGRSVVIN